MTRQRKRTKLIAVLAGVSLLAAACGDDDDGGGGGGDTSPGDTTTGGGADTQPPSDTTGDEMPADTTDGGGGGGAGGTPQGTITYAQAQEFSSLNNNSADQNSVKNGVITGPTLPDFFPFAAPDGYPQQDEELVESGEVTSENPFTVEIVVNPDAVWSDGEPIDCDDAYLQWLAMNGQLKELNQNGQPRTDPETGDPILLFNPAGTTGYEQIESVDCSNNQKTITLNFSEPFADWQTLWNDMVPAHVVEREAGVEDLMAAHQNNNRQALEALAEFWKTGFTPQPGQIDPNIFVSGDALQIDSWRPGQSLTMVVNESYWGTPPGAEQVVVRFIPEEGQAQALQNGEIQVMDPQPTPDLKTTLDGIQGADVQPGVAYVWEHFDYNFRNQHLKDRRVREAFAKCLPRQQMVANLIQPMVPEAQVLNNRWVQEFEEGYEDTSGGAYDQVDIEGASQLMQEYLSEAGVDQVELRLGWHDDGSNQRRTNQSALTQESCNQVEGLQITDVGDDTFFEGGLDSGQGWDIAMFAWAGSPAKSGSIAAYETGGGNNNGSYSNEEVDQLLNELKVEPDPARVVEIANQIDRILWEDLATVPVFSHPALAASMGVEGVQFNPSQNGITWNARDWVLTQ